MIKIAKTNNSWEKLATLNYAYAALAAAIVSLFIFGQYLSVTAVVLGVLGIFASTKVKVAQKVLYVNIAAVVIGIISRLLLTMVVGI